MHPLKPNFAALFGLFLACFLPNWVLGQTCVYSKIEHLSGTEQVACSEVTVTSDGSVAGGAICAKGPYFIGPDSTGSYTFSFSPAVSGVRLGFYGLNNNFNSLEEVAISINGSFYPVTNDGQPDGCLAPAVISPGGTIRACMNCSSSWKDVIITENISSIQVEDIYLLNEAFGVIFSIEICCACNTSAGELTSDPLELCQNQTAEIPAATQTVLESNDLLQYILFSDLLDTLGSIVATSNTPSFNFNPATMQTGTLYYIAAIAGAGLNGNVNFNAPCLSVSNAISVTWSVVPSVAFTVANPNICAGACTEVTATFTGTPPFILTYTIPGSAPITEVFTGNVHSFQACVPPGAPAGSLSLQATELTDANCTCQ